MNTNKLVQLMKEKEMSIYKLSKLTGLSDGGLNGIIHGKKKDPRISTVKKIAKALEVDINEII